MRNTFVLEKRNDNIAKEATLQAQMNVDLKEKAEILYQEQGTSFAEVERILAKQSVLKKGISFLISANHRNTYDRFSQYEDPVKWEQ